MTGARRREPAAARRGVSGAVPSGGMLGRTPEGQALAGREAAGGGVSGCGARKIPPMCEQSGRGVAKTGNYLYLCAVPSAERHFCGNSSVGRASASQAEGRGFESRFPLMKISKLWRKLPLADFLFAHGRRTRCGAAVRNACPDSSGGAVRQSLRRRIRRAALRPFSGPAVRNRLPDGGTEKPARQVRPRLRPQGPERTAGIERNGFETE